MYHEQMLLQLSTVGMSVQKNWPYHGLFIQFVFLVLQKVAKNKFYYGLAMKMGIQ